MFWRKYVLTTACLIVALGGSSSAVADDPAAFFEAISHQNVTAVLSMLDAHPDWANAKNDKGRSAVIVALFLITDESFMVRDKNPVLQAILAKSPTLTFYEACGVGRAPDVKRFLEKDPKLARCWNDFGWSALHLAAFSGDVDTARLVLENGAAVEARAKTRFRNSPLQVALLGGHFDVAKLLIAHGADVLVRQSQGWAPIHEAAVLGRQDLVDLLLESGAEINSRTDDGRTPVTEAERRKHPELAAYLRSKGGVGAEIGDVTKSPD
jgi:ankyrin repeat protein